MAAQQLDLPPDFKGEVRLFPLPNLVMFPSNVLPLHIFESRYREMFEDAIQGDQLITMAALKPGFETDYYSRPAVASVVCIGQVTAQGKTEQGTYNLMLVGLQRALIVHEIEPVRSFRRAAVKLINERPLELDVKDAAKIGDQLVKQMLQILPAAEKLIEEFTQGNVSLASLTDIFAFHLPLRTDFKLQLLGEGDAGRRAKLLLKNLASETPRPAKNKLYPRNFSAN